MALAATLLIVQVAPTFATSGVDLTVKGTLTPAACTPVLSNNGLVDYGKISRQDLNVDKRTRLHDKTLDLGIQCKAPTRFALLMQDARDGSAIVNSQIYYGLNYDRSGNKIGLYSLNFDPRSTVVDAWPQVYRTDSTTGGLAWSPARSDTLPVGARGYLGFTRIAGSTAGPMAIENLNSRVTLETVIAPTSTLDLSGDVALDGSATLEMHYL